MDVIGMTALPEAKLAREAELCYATIACVTDYDCWHELEEAVTVEMVMGHLQANVTTAQRILRTVAQKLPASREQQTCGCASALDHAIITEPARIPPEVREKYALLTEKYLA
jgi:5'-methylthioadenosine phosphorylase